MQSAVKCLIGKMNSNELVKCIIATFTIESPLLERSKYDTNNGRIDVDLYIYTDVLVKMSSPWELL